MNPLLILLIIVVAIIATSFVVVQQGTISVITMFGKYRRILSPGLNFRIPLIEKVATKISIQNRSLEMEFQAITQDQANVYFKAMLVYSVLNADEETIKNVAFKFHYLLNGYSKFIPISLIALVVIGKKNSPNFLSP